jgi:membrane protease YdiL (CAAX protease family)
LNGAQLGFLLGWAWVEEALWRRLLLGTLAVAVGTAAALAVTTILFALAHGRARWQQAVTGAVFGAVFLATGRLTAAFATHATYNLLVASRREPP